MICYVWRKLITNCIFQTCYDDHLARSMQVGRGVVIDRQRMRPYIRGCIIEKGYGDLLEDKGGKVKLSSSWIGQLMRDMDLSYRKATTAAQKLPSDWEEQGETFALR